MCDACFVGQGRQSFGGGGGGGFGGGASFGGGAVGGGRNSIGGADQYAAAYGGGRQSFGAQGQAPAGQFGGGRQSFGAQGQAQGGGMQPMLMPGSVVMVYQLDQRFNVDRLFNWMCLFANPHKIKFIVQKPGTAMVQFGHPQEAQEAMGHAHETVVFGQKVECA